MTRRPPPVIADSPIAKSWICSRISRHDGCSVTASVASSDRAFHLLASESPDTFRQLIELALPGLLPEGARVDREDVDESRLDVPAAIDADFVARVEPSDLLHAEFQGYRDSRFLDRLFRYHLLLVLRYPERHVRTVALWMTAPSAAQRQGLITRGGVTIRVTSIVVPELPASLLLQRAQTACFAPAADAEGRSAEELCALVAQSLAENRATRTQMYMAVVAAITCGRYTEMVSAMQRSDLEPVIIEDLVRFGMDQGFEQGLERGIEQGLERGIEQGLERGVEQGLKRGRQEALDAVRLELRNALRARVLICTPEEQARLDSESSLSTLLRWVARAGTAKSVREILDR